MSATWESARSLTKNAGPKITKAVARARPIRPIESPPLPTRQASSTRSGRALNFLSARVGLAELDLVAVRVVDPGRADDARQVPHLARLDPALGDAGQLGVDVVDEHRHEALARPAVVADQVDPAAVGELPRNLVVVGDQV